MRKILFSFLTVAFCYLAPHNLYAANLFVSTTPPVGGSDCSTAALACSLTQALSVAADGDEIKLAAGDYTVSTGDQVIQVGKNLTIQGALDGISSINGQNSRRGFFIIAGKTAIISNVLIVNGKGGGAGILNLGNLLLKDSFIQDNHAGNGAFDLGGGLSNLGIAILNNVVIQDNTAYSGAGVINVRVGRSEAKLSILNSSIVNNATSALGGKGAGLFNANGELYLANVTVSGNQTTGSGAGLFQTLGTSVTHFSTFYNNHADTAGTHSSSGGGFYIEGGTLASLASVFANNHIGLDRAANDCVTAGAGDLFQTYNINLIGAVDSACRIQNMTPGVANLTGTVTEPLDAKLRELSVASLGLLFLQRNHTPIPGSPVIDKIPQTQCRLGLGETAALLTIDQRASARPYSPSVEKKCDLGAVEATPALVPLESNTHRYADTQVGSTLAHNLVLTNVGDIAMKVSEASVDNTNFNVNISDCTADILPGSHCTVAVNFAPTQVGEQHGVLTVKTTAPIFNQFTYTLDGKALAAADHDVRDQQVPLPRGGAGVAGGGCSMSVGSVGGLTSLLPFVFVIASFAIRRRK